MLLSRAAARTRSSSAERRSLGGIGSPVLRRVVRSFGSTRVRPAVRQRGGELPHRCPRRGLSLRRRDLRHAGRVSVHPAEHRGGASARPLHEGGGVHKARARPALRERTTAGLFDRSPRDRSYDLAVRSNGEADEAPFGGSRSRRLRLVERRSRSSAATGARSGRPPLGMDAASGAAERPLYASPWTLPASTRAAPACARVFDVAQVPLQGRRCHGQAVAAQPRRDVAPPRVAFVAHLVELRSQHRDGLSLANLARRASGLLGDQVFELGDLGKWDLGGGFRRHWALGSLLVHRRRDAFQHSPM